MATITQKNTLAALILAAGLGPVAAQDAALETQIVDAMNKAYGLARLPPAKIAARLCISEPKLKRFMRRVHAAREMPRPEPARPRQPRHQAPSSDADRLLARPGQRPGDTLGNNTPEIRTMINGVRVRDSGVELSPPERTVGEARERHPTARFELLRESWPDRRG
jgi:hypothetical protein